MRSTRGRRTESSSEISSLLRLRTNPVRLAREIFAKRLFFLFTERNYTGNPLGCWVPAAGDLQWQRPVWHLCNTVNNFAMDKKCAQLWQRLSAALKPQVSADSFKRWFSNVELIDAKDKSITLTVPNNIYQLWIESNYMPALQNAIITTFGGPRSVKFCAPRSEERRVGKE